MISLWFAIAALSLITYAVMDGFDLGSGALHLFVARNDRERRAVFAAIGPFWDGNEVWLLASAGVLFVAFPAVLAAAFSGVYLSLSEAEAETALRPGDLVSAEITGSAEYDLAATVHAVVQPAYRPPQAVKLRVVA